MFNSTRKLGALVGVPSLSIASGTRPRRLASKSTKSALVGVPSSSVASGSRPHRLVFKPAKLTALVGVAMLLSGVSAVECSQGDRVKYAYLDGKLYTGRVAQVYSKTVTIECDQFGLSHWVDKNFVMCKLENPEAEPMKPLQAAAPKKRLQAAAPKTLLQAAAPKKLPALLHMAAYVRFRRKRTGLARMNSSLKTDHGVIDAVDYQKRAYTIRSDTGKSYSNIPADKVTLVREVEYAKAEFVAAAEGTDTRQKLTEGEWQASFIGAQGDVGRRRRLNYMRRFRRAQRAA